VTVIWSSDEETDQSGIAETRIEKRKEGQAQCFDYSLGKQTISDSETSCPIKMAKKNYPDLVLQER
jgi:hypothetical protein